jgi:hypothetical protein
MAKPACAHLEAIGIVKHAKRSELSGGTRLTRLAGSPQEARS